MTQEVKTCTKCKETKPLDRFGLNPTCRGQHATRCKDCDNAYQRKYYFLNVKKRMLLGARDRALRDDVPFSILEEDISIPAFYPALGIPLAAVPGRGGADGSPSIDRIVPSKGYVKGNVVVISSRANRIKSNATAQDILAVGNWLLRRENLLTKVSNTTSA